MTKETDVNLKRRRLLVAVVLSLRERIGGAGWVKWDHLHPPVGQGSYAGKPDTGSTTAQKRKKMVRSTITSHTKEADS